MIKKIDPVAIAVRDMVKAVALFQDTLGLEDSPLPIEEVHRRCHQVV